MSEYNRHRWAMEWMYGGGRDPRGRSLDDEIKLGKEDWMERQRVAQGGRIGYRFGSRGPGAQVQEDKRIKELMEERFKSLMDKSIKSTPEGVLTEQIYPDSDAMTLDRPSKPEIITEAYDPYAPDSPTASSLHPKAVEYDDGTIYYKDTGEWYLEDGTQVDGPSPGAKPIPETLEAREGGRIGLQSGQLVQPGPGRPGYGDWKKSTEAKKIKEAQEMDKVWDRKTKRMRNRKVGS